TTEIYALSLHDALPICVSKRAARKVVFSGVGKTEAEIEAALKAQILMFNVESESELSALADCAARLKRVAPLALRVNPDVPAKRSEEHTSELQSQSNLV